MCRVSVGEYVQYAKKVDYFKIFHDLGVLEGDEELNGIYQAVQENANIINELNTRMRAEMQYEAGDMFIESITRKALVENKEIGLGDKMGLLLGDNLHTGKLVKKGGSFDLWTAQCFNALLDVKRAEQDPQYTAALSNALRKYDITWDKFSVEELGKAISKHYGSLAENTSVRKFMEDVTKSIEEEMPNYLKTHPKLNPLKMYENSRQKGVAHMSHLTHSGVGSDTQLSIARYLYSDIYNIKVEKLINGEHLEALRGKYGEGYVDVINAKYREIENDFHQSSKQKFGNVVLAGMTHAFKAGLANLIPPFGHSKVKPDDLNKLHDKITNGVTEKTEMICSEFAARTTVAAFIELNNQLKKELGITDPDKNVIDVNFLAKERFSKVHPTRLIEILQSLGCIEKAPRTKTEQQYINFAARVNSESEGRHEGRS